MTLGQSIRYLRHSNLPRTTQQHFATKVGISQTYMSQIESDKKVPTIDTLQMIAAELGVKVSEIFLTNERL